MRARDSVFWLSFQALAVWGCTSTTQLAEDFAQGGLTAGAAGSAGSLIVGGFAGTGAGGAGGASGSAGSAGSACQVTPCLGKVYACGDCVDNDMDGWIDSDDIECTGPCDNTEDSYYGGIPGGNNAPCRQDCYFDQDTGSGNDGCEWSQTCDPLSVAPGYPPSGDANCSYNPNANIPGGNGSCASLALAQSTMCTDFCLPLTPNGCDCFGCCELPAGSGSFVWLGSSTQDANMQKVGTCNQTTVGDPALCHPCTPVRSCFNSCEPCEHCVGRPMPDPSCVETGGRCADGRACGDSGDPDCPLGEYCITGCCEAVPK